MQKATTIVTGASDRRRKSPPISRSGADRRQPGKKSRGLGCVRGVVGEPFAQSLFLPRGLLSSPPFATFLDPIDKATTISRTPE